MPVVPAVCVLVAPDDPLELLPEMAAAGVDGFQVRAKGSTDRELMSLVLHVRELVGDGPKVLVNDRVDVALAVGADGVHLGRDDLPVAAVRRVAAQQPGFLVGATCRTRTQVAEARSAGADYAGFGPVWPTTSKAGLPRPRGLHAADGPDCLASAADVLPLLAIGGVTSTRAKAAIDVGAHGVAVIAGVWRRPDPVAAAAALVEAVRR